MSERLVDVREIPPAKRHSTIFSVWQGLPVGGVLKLVVDHDPKPLYYEFQAERGGQFRWEPVERGPERWVVQIARIAPDAFKPVTLEDTVKDIAERHPAAREVLVRHGLDLCCGGAHPLGMAVQAHGVDGGEILAELNAAFAPPAAAPAPDAKPAWAESWQHDVDVREDLRSGLEPFAKILSTVSKVRVGEVMRLRAIFEPRPLYKVLSFKGFEHWTHQAAADDWWVLFRKAR